MGERGVRGTWGREGEGERESMCFREALQVQARLRLSFPFSTTPCTCPAAELYLPNSPPWRSGGRHSCCRWPGRSTQLLCSLLPHPPPMHSTPAQCGAHQTRRNAPVLAICPLPALKSKKARLRRIGIRLSRHSNPRDGEERVCHRGQPRPLRALRTPAR